MNFFDKFYLKHQHRIVGLDILRSIAILLVLFVHGKALVPKENQDFYRNLNFFKIDGVSLFFVLSGFLIGGILLKMIANTNFTKKDMLNFWIRRWFRTIPNYILILIVLVTYYQLKFNNGFEKFSIEFLFFTQNFNKPHPAFFSEAWSLTIEEWFYLLFPMSCYLLNRLSKNKAKSLLFSAIVFLLIPLILRIVKFESGVGLDDLDANFRKIVALRLDSLMYGIIAAYVNFKHHDLWLKIGIPSLIAGFFLLIMLYFNPYKWSNYYFPLQFNIESITTLLFIPYLSTLKTTKIKLLDVFFIFISIVSYALYIVNYSLVIGCLIPMTPIFMYKLGISVPETTYFNFIFFWIYSFVGSVFIYKFYEHPMTKLRDKFSK